MLISETFINATKGYQFGNSEPYEPFTDDTGRLFRSLQREYGRCQSRVYIDTKNGTKAIGWVFSKVMTYEDARADWSKDQREYVREVWVNLYDECEHGDPAELSKTHGRERCATGLKYHELPK
jgi:hypothetical protein